MTTTTIFADITDGRIASVDVVYATARAGSALVVRTADTGSEGQTHTGQIFSTPSYLCFEGFFQFDTSVIPDTDTIESVVFSLYGQYDGSVTDFVIEARLKDWGTALDTADWVAGADLGALTLLATYATSGGWSTTAYNAFTSEAPFASNINKTGFTRLMTCSSRMVAGNTPTGEERINSFMADDTSGTKDPKLVVVHSAPPSMFIVSSPQRW